MTVAQLIRALQDVPATQNTFPVLVKINGKWLAVNGVLVDPESKTVDILGDET